MAAHDGRGILNAGHPEVRITPDRLDSAIGAALEAELVAEIERRYGGPDPDEPIADEVAPPDGIFVVAWLGDEPAGCGALRRFAEDPSAGELKRMYTRPDARRRGVGRSVLTVLEVHAVELGYGRLVLETGLLQPEAISLYESAGFEPIRPYGYYADHPTSRCFGKALDRSPRGSARGTSG